MARNYMVVNDADSVERLGKFYSWRWYECFIPRDYREHEYPAFLEWNEPWDAHEHGYWSWTNITMEEYVQYRTKEINETKAELEVEIQEKKNLIELLEREEKELKEMI